MKIRNTNKDRDKESIENRKRISFGSFRVNKFQFLLSVLQHRPSWNGWLPFNLGVVISQRNAVRCSPAEFLLYNMLLISRETREVLDRIVVVI